MSENEIEMNVEDVVEFHVAKPRGRKPKYLTEEERKMAIAVANAACANPFSVTDINK